jgi:hypothetical protein
MLDDADAEDTIHRLLMKDPELLRLQRQLLRHQERLKKAVSEETFKLYLAVDATVGAMLDVFGSRVWEAARKARDKKTSPGTG